MATKAFKNVAGHNHKTKPVRASKRVEALVFQIGSAASARALEALEQALYQQLNRAPHIGGPLMDEISRLYDPKNVEVRAHYMSGENAFDRDKTKSNFLEALVVIAHQCPKQREKVYRLAYELAAETFNSIPLIFLSEIMPEKGPEVTRKILEFSQKDGLDPEAITRFKVDAFYPARHYPSFFDNEYMPVVREIMDMLPKKPKDTGLYKRILEASRAKNLGLRLPSDVKPQPPQNA